MNSTYNQNNQNKSANNQSDLSKSAGQMRSEDPKARNDAAHKMGHAGGQQSHKNTNTSTSGNR